MHRHLARAAALSLVALVALACAAGTRVGDPPEPPRPTLSATPAATPSLELDALVSGLGGDAGVWVVRPGEPRPLYAHNAEEPMLAASLYKLAVLLEVERRVDAGQLSYDDEIEIADEDVTIDGSNVYPGTVLSIDEALEQMITYSDNGTALALLRTLGPTATNAALARAGIAGFHVATDQDDDHTVTARALGTYFGFLAQRSLVSAKASTRMYERLVRQRINDRIPAQLPADTRVAHKTGDLIGYVHDAGIVETPGGPLVVVVLTRDAPDADARSFIAEVASRSYAAVKRAPQVQATSLTDAAAAVARSVVSQGADGPSWPGIALGAGVLAVGGYAYLRVRHARVGRSAWRGSAGARPRRMAVPDRPRRR